MKKYINDYWSTAILWAVLSLVIVWFGIILSNSYTEGMNLLEIVIELTSNLQTPFSISFNKNTPICILFSLLCYGLGISYYYANKGKRRPGKEHGSAVWGNAKLLNNKYMNKKQPSENIILTQNLQIGLNTRLHRRNLNILVIGGSGAGKTRFFAKPNIMQGNTSFLVTDPKGEILRSTGHLLEKEGYEIKVFDLINPELSDSYNPFSYIRDDKDVLKLVNNLIKNTTPKTATNNDPFWEKAEIALDTALILYLLHEAPKEEQNFATLMFLLENATPRENDEDYHSPVDLLFEALEEEQPDHIAVKQYKIFKQSAGKTAKSILISASVRLSAFILPQIAHITSTDTLDLGSLGEKKKAIFAVIPDNDSSLNYLIGMLYTQCFQELYYKADHIYGGRLPVHVRMIMDEFANVALPDDFERILSTMRSREISASIIIQNMAQLKALFKDSWENVTGNCDTLIYLGGNEQSTHEYISKLLGKETIDTRSFGLTKGKSGSSSTNFQITGRELLTPDEVRMIKNELSVVFIRGEKAIIDDKYDILKHKNIKFTQDGGYEPFKHGNIDYSCEDLHFTFSSLENIEIIELGDDSDENDKI